MACASDRFQPMLVQLDVYAILRVASIARPHLALDKAHAIQRLRRESGTSVGELLGIGICAAHTLDDAGAAANVPRRAHVPGRVGTAHAHVLARLEALVD